MKNQEVECGVTFSAESEYPAMASVTCEMVWIRDLLTEFDSECPMRLYSDN